MNINLPPHQNRFNTERDRNLNNVSRLPTIAQNRSYIGSLQDITIGDTSLAIQTERPIRNNALSPMNDQVIKYVSKSIILPETSFGRFDTSFNAQNDTSLYANMNRHNSIQHGPYQGRNLALAGQRSLPELSPIRDFQTNMIRNPPLQQPQMFSPPPNYPFYPGFQVPMFVRPKKKSHPEEKRIFEHIEKQTQMIESLATKLNDQQQQYLDRGKRELEEKLKLIEMENQIKLQEMKFREMASTNTKNSKDESGSKKKKPKQKDRYLDVLGKLILSQEGLPSQIDENSEDDEGRYSPTRSPRKDPPNMRSPLRSNLSPVSMPSGMPNYNQMQNNNHYNHPSSPSRRFPESPHKHNPYNNSPNSYGRQPFYPNQGGYHPNHGGYPMQQMPYPNQYAGNYYQNYPQQGYGQQYYPQQEGLNYAEKSDVNMISPEELTKRRKARTKTIKKEKEENNVEETSKPKKNIPAIRSNLRKILCVMTYSQLLFADVRNKVEKRKHQIQVEMVNLISANFEAVQEWLIALGSKFVLAFAQEKKSLELYNSKKNISDKDLDARITIIIANYKQLFDKMIVNTNETLLPQNLLRFLASISEDSGVLPSGFMFDFEVKRLQFTYYATLKNMTPLKSKMVIGCFILLRVLLHKLIMRPWQSIPGVSESSVNKANLLTVGSILYHTVLDFYRSNLQVFSNNQSFLPSELKVRARTIPLTAEEANPYEQQDAGPKRHGTIIIKEQEPIVGFLTKEQLRGLFFDRKKKYDEIKALVDGWLEKIYTLTHKVFEATPKEDRETLGFPK